MDTELRQEEKRLTDTALYVVNLDSGKVHRRFRIEGSRQFADFPRCNLDQIKNRRDLKNREQIAAALGPRMKPKPCLRCFPPPTPEAEELDAAVPIEEDPGTDPDAERVSIDEMDPEDRP